MAFHAKENIILHQLFGSKKFCLYITIEKSEKEKSSLIQRLKQTLQYFSILTETHTNHDQIHLTNLHFGSVSPSVAPARAGEEGKKILLCDYCRRKKDGTQPIGWPRSFSLLEIVTEKGCFKENIRKCSKISTIQEKVRILRLKKDNEKEKRKFQSGN